MVPARKTGWLPRAFNAWFARHVRGLLRERFSELRVHGLDRVQDAARHSPVFIVSNHTSWWDPLLVVYFSNLQLRTDGYGMMDAKNLRTFPFFRAVGAFGVDLDHARDGARAIRYSTDLLSRPGRMLWVFAQGAEVPITARPLHFQRGASLISEAAARRSDAITVPVGLRYEFAERERPFVYVSFGPPLASGLSRTERHEMLVRGVERELQRIDHAIESRDVRDFATCEQHREPRSAKFALAMLRRLFS
jgi:1-acyl-sn-glycerol-3-phosphate acyltransferase